MANLISDRAFGSDIFGPVKETLKSRQSGSDARAAEGESVQFTNYNSNIAVPPGSNLDLSSRKPWARMWTVVRSYSVDKDETTLENKKSYDQSKVALYEIGNHIYDDYNLHGYSKDTATALDKVVPDSMNTWNEFNKASAGITGVQSSTQGDYGVYVETIVDFKVYNFFDYSNIVTKFFLHPGARVFVDMGWDTANAYDQSQYFTVGTENVETADQHYHKMHNDIFNIDTGKITKSGGDLWVAEGYVTDWNSKSLPDGSFECSITITSGNKSLLEYDRNSSNLFTKDVTQVIVERFFAFFGMDDMEGVFDLDFLFRNSGESQDTNPFFKLVLDKLGNTESVHLGTFYDLTKLKGHQKVLDDGGFNCPSDPEAAERLGCEPNKWVEVKTRAALREQIIKSEDGEDQSAYEKAFRYPVIPPIARDVGVYFAFLDDHSDQDAAPDSLWNLTYVTWKFFEEELLNKYLGMKFTEDMDKEIKFDSSNQVMQFHENLYWRQVWTRGFRNNNAPIPFLYPTHDPDGLKAAGKIPIHEMFVSLESIVTHFSTADNIFSAITGLLTDINTNGANVFKLKLISQGDNKMAVVDLNSPIVNLTKSEKEANANTTPGQYGYAETGEEIKFNTNGQYYYIINDGDDDGGGAILVSAEDVEAGLSKETTDAHKSGYNFDDLFVFNPYSPNTLTKNMDLSLEMPSNVLSSMIAINATSVGSPIYPGSQGIFMALGLKDLHQMDSENDQGDLDNKFTGNHYFEWLPSTDVDFADSLNDSMLGDQYTALTKPDDDGIGDNENVKKTFIKNIGKYFDESDITNWIDKVDEEYDSTVTRVVDTYTKAGGKVSTTAAEAVDTMQLGAGERAVLVSSISDYYYKKLVNEKVGEVETSDAGMQLPYSISMSIYGIAGMYPGNVFRVDYLPQVYSNKVIFIVETVNHTYTADQWTTTFTGWMMYRSDKVFGNTESFKPVLRWNPKALSDLGYTTDQIVAANKDPDFPWWTWFPNETKKMEQELGIYQLDEQGKVTSDKGNVEFIVDQSDIHDANEDVDSDNGESPVDTVEQYFQVDLDEKCGDQQSKQDCEAASENCKWFPQTLEGVPEEYWADMGFYGGYCEDQRSWGCLDYESFMYQEGAQSDCMQSNNFVKTDNMEEHYYTDNPELASFNFSCCAYWRCPDWQAMNWGGCLGYGNTECYHYIHANSDYQNVENANPHHGQTCLLEVMDTDVFGGCNYPNFADTDENFGGFYNDENDGPNDSYALQKGGGIYQDRPTYYSAQYCSEICSMSGQGGWNLSDAQECEGFDDGARFAFQEGMTTIQDGDDDGLQLNEPYSVYMEKSLAWSGLAWHEMTPYWSVKGLQGTQGLCWWWVADLAQKTTGFHGNVLGRWNTPDTDNGWPYLDNGGVDTDVPEYKKEMYLKGHERHNKCHINPHKCKDVFYAEHPTLGWHYWSVKPECMTCMLTGNANSWGALQQSCAGAGRSGGYPGHTYESRLDPDEALEMLGIEDHQNFAYDSTDDMFAYFWDDMHTKGSTRSNYRVAGYSYCQVVSDSGNTAYWAGGGACIPQVLPIDSDPENKGKPCRWNPTHPNGWSYRPDITSFDTEWASDDSDVMGGYPEGEGCILPQEMEAKKGNILDCPHWTYQEGGETKYMIDHRCYHAQSSGTYWMLPWGCFEIADNWYIYEMGKQNPVHNFCSDADGNYKQGDCSDDQLQALNTSWAGGTIEKQCEFWDGGTDFESRYAAAYSDKDYKFTKHGKGSGNFDWTAPVPEWPSMNADGPCSYHGYTYTSDFNCESSTASLGTRKSSKGVYSHNQSCNAEYDNGYGGMGSNCQSKACTSEYGCVEGDPNYRGYYKNVDSDEADHFPYVVTNKVNSSF